MTAELLKTSRSAVRKDRANEHTAQFSTEIAANFVEAGEALHQTEDKAMAVHMDNSSMQRDGRQPATGGRRMARCQPPYDLFSALGRPDPDSTSGWGNPPPGWHEPWPPWFLFAFTQDPIPAG
jgi:hypothetical protein